jgi:hypothetical protein
MVLNSTWNKFKNLHRIMCLALCLGVVCFALAGNAWAAGTTRLTAAPTVPSTFATEATLTAVAGGNTYKLVNNATYNSDLYRDMTVARTTAQNFLVVVTLSNGATFQGPGVGCPAGYTCVLPAGGDVSVTAVSGAGAGAAAFTVAAGGTTGSNQVTFLSNIGTTFTGFPTLRIAAGASGWTIKDPSNRLNAGSITAQVQTFDAADSSSVDNGGTDSAPIAAAAFAVVITNAMQASTATVDVSTNRKNFVATPAAVAPAGPDTLTADNGARIGIGYASTLPLKGDGTPFALAAGDTVRFTLTSSNDLSGLLTATGGSITWGGIAATTVAGSTKINVAGNNANIGLGYLPFVFTVDGSTTLPTRTIFAQIDLVLVAGSTQAGGSRNLQAGTTTATVWNFNGSVLVANWLSGNTALYSSRIYIWNPSTLAGDVTARVFSMQPVGGTVVSTELTTPGAPFALGIISGATSMNIKLQEDILAFLPTVTLPYTINGGNLTVEVTIRASGVKGTAQVFKKDGTMAFGQVDLMVVQ